MRIDVSVVVTAELYSIKLESLLIEGEESLLQVVSVASYANHYTVISSDINIDRPDKLSNFGP